MCKILVIPHVKPSNYKNVWKFVETVTKPLVATERHGFGYMALDDKGNLFGERWVNVNDAFRVRETLSKFELSLLNLYKGFLNSYESYNSFGAMDQKRITSICLHGRTATSEVSLRNTHPFVSGDTALIHNGVVSTCKLKLHTSTCDSEGILNQYLEENVGADIQNVQRLADKLQGWYACAAYTKVKDKWYLDVFKDNKSNLEAVFVEELDSLVFCTSAKVIYAACKKLKWTIRSAFAVRSNAIIRIDPLTGQVIEIKNFVSEKPFNLLSLSNNYNSAPEKVSIAREVDNFWDSTGYTDDTPPSLNPYEDTTAISAAVQEDIMEYQRRIPLKKP